MNDKNVKKQNTALFSGVCVIICFALVIGIFFFASNNLSNVSLSKDYLYKDPTSADAIDEALCLDTLTIPTIDYAENNQSMADSGTATNAIPQPSHADKKPNALDKNQNYSSFESQSNKKPVTNTKPQVTEPTKVQGSTSGSVSKDDLTILSTKALDLVYYCQVWPEYKNVPYGSNTIGGYGCGPTNMAMVISTLTDNIVSPIEMAKWAVDNGHYVKNVGTTHAFMSAAAKKYGIKVSTISKTDKGEITKALKDGKILLTVMKAGHFTKGSHFMIIRGITDSGKLLVADSGSYSRSIAEWDYNTVISELKLSYFWVYEN